MIGIALVVDDVRKGFKLAFRYPVVPKGSLCSRTMQFHEIESGLFAKLFRPKSVLCNQTFELIIDGLHFVSYPVLVNRNEHKSKDTTMFNVVIALDEQHSTGSTSKIDAFRDITSQIVNAMLHEEMRTGFVSHEVRILLNADDELSQADKNTTTTSSNDWDPNRTLAARQTLIDVALERSRLANSLKDIYHGLKESGTVHVVMNDWVKLSLTIHRCFESCSIKSFRPYHTLLLLRDEERVLESLPFDCSPQLERLIKASNPLRSFQELHLELGISLKQLYRLAAHLVYWGVARIITTVTKYSIYQVHPSANIDPNSTLSVEFRRKFPPNELHQVLSTFSATRRLGEYLKKLNSVAQTEFLYIIMWLLRHDLIFQLHRYVYLLINPTETPMRIEPYEKATSPIVPKSEMDDDDAIPLSAEELAVIEQLPSKGPIHILFKRLCVYFRGNHHLEEIIYRENITRSELRAVLNTYNEIAVCCLH